MIPPELLKTLQKAHHKTTYFGPQGFALPLSEDELQQFQLGFSVHPDGHQLTGTEPGDWQPSWQVIAMDTELGDPYFIDNTAPNLPVYTAIHLESGWAVEAVAASLSSFLDCLNELAALSDQDEPQVIPTATTITHHEKLEQLQLTLIERSGCSQFWTLFMECYLDWLEEE